MTIKNLSLILLATLMCCACDDTNKNEPDVPGGNNSTDFTVSNYTSFEVALSAGPLLLSEVAETTYKSPGSPYGMVPQLDLRVNSDNTIDVIWEKKGKVALCKISLETQKIVKYITIPATVTGDNYLGFEKIGADKYIIGYGKTNEFGQRNSEAWYIAFDESGTELFSTCTFGRNDTKKIGSKFNPGLVGRGSSVIRYNEKNNTIALYLAFNKRFDNGVHQAGWVGFLDASTGQMLKTDDDKHIGDEWFYSHNFDQRCMVSASGDFYTLAHGDAYPRALVFDRWSGNGAKAGGLKYYEIAEGAFFGDNKTYTNTGDFMELEDGTIMIAYSTEDERKQRDLRICAIDNVTSEPTVSTEKWITEYADNYVGWGTKLSSYKKDILLAWNTFDNEEETGTGTKMVVIDKEGNKLTDIVELEETLLHPMQSMYTTTDGDKIIFVSGSEAGVKVNVVEVK